MDVKPEHKISAEKLRSSLKLKNMGECLQTRRLQWLGHLERMEGSAWSSKYRSSKASGSFSKE